MLTWEYKVEVSGCRGMSEEDLNKLGSEGWMLMPPFAVTVPPDEIAARYDSTPVLRIMYHFKRPIGVRDFNSINDDSQKH